MEIPPQISEGLTSKATSLESLGLYEVGWAKADALQVLTELRGSYVVILGGDVYIASQSGIRPAYNNWACERESGEKLRNYAERSRKAASSFIRTYPASGSDRTLFVLVFEQGETAGL